MPFGVVGETDCAESSCAGGGRVLTQLTLLEVQVVAVASAQVRIDVNVGVVVGQAFDAKRDRVVLPLPAHNRPVVIAADERVVTAVGRNRPRARGRAALVLKAPLRELAALEGVG